MDSFSYYSHPNSCESSSSVENHHAKENNNNNKKGTINNNGGKRSSKVVKLSTDPQSVAARERRHRISDRFKILQSLVPGGTKMDTVSMLEEAIHYVKFLKAQIWLHQTMIHNHFVDDNPNSLPVPPSVTTTSTLSAQQNLYSHGENFVAHEVVHSSVPVFELPGYVFQGEENMSFDGNINY